MRSVLLVAMLGMSCVAIGSDIFPHTDPQNTKGWKLVEQFSDEFEGASLCTNKWQPRCTYWHGRQPSWFSPKNVRVEQGRMTLTSKWEPEGIPAQFQKQGYSNYTAVCVSSVQKVMYGYFEIRCKAAPICMTSSFWFQGKNSEIDVFEIIGKAKILKNTETKMPTNIHSGFKDGWDKDKADPFDYDVGNKVAENFNVFGLEWDTTNLVFYCNGKVVRMIENKGRFVEPQTMFFDMETFKWHGYPEPSELPGDFEIDYIRTWTK